MQYDTRSYMTSTAANIFMLVSFTVLNSPYSTSLIHNYQKSMPYTHEESKLMAMYSGMIPALPP
jgi:hypothetical protein